MKLSFTIPKSRAETESTDAAAEGSRVKIRRPKHHRLPREALQRILIEDVDFHTRLSYDEIRQTILLDAEPLSEGGLHALALGVLAKYRFAEVGSDVLADCVQSVAKARGFNVVRSYLQALEEPPKQPLLELPLLFGISHDDSHFALYAEYCRCFFVGAVARALSPACKNDTVFVLTGPQGIGKSSFFRIMAEAAGPELFHDGLCNIGKRDDLMAMNAHWILEWAEIEELIERSASGRVKAFLSAQRDFYRAPYARLPEAHPRHFALAATTNERVFLRDPTGSRRFLVLPCTRIDLSEATRGRDAIWADAYRRYLRGETWWLSDDFMVAQTAVNRDVELADEADEMAPILAELIPPEVEKIESGEALRLFTESCRTHGFAPSMHLFSKAMKELGYSKKRSASRRWWER